MTFSEFWKLYPRKVARKDAERAWNKLSTPQQEKALATIATHAKCWMLEGRQSNVIPHGATWLNGERFDDELELPQPKMNMAQIGQKLGIQARPGESQEQYERRILQTRH